MRARLAFFLFLCSFDLFAQVDDVSEANAAWRDVLAAAQRDRKPVTIFFRTRRCVRCDELERGTVPHPAIQRRLPGFAFATLPATEGEAAKLWASADPGVAFFDRAGVLRARWIFVPDTTNFGVILDAVTAVAADFERAVVLSESGAPHDGDLHAGIGLARLGRITDARSALGRARASGNTETRQAAIVASAVLDANEGKSAHALAELQPVAANPATPKIGADAWLAIGAIHRASDAGEEAIRAFTAAAEVAGNGSPEQAAARQALARLQAARAPAERAAIHILPLGRQLVSGRQIVKTHVSSAAVARVSFSLDGREIHRVERPPFSATLDFGAVPERRSIRAVAFDRKGRQIGSDERVVNEAGETFWLRLVTPREGVASGSVRVSMNVRVPASRGIRRVAVSWNDAERAVLTAAPWEAVLEIPDGQLGVLRAEAELDDGRTSEDAVLLNAGGVAGRADVQLVELPITIVSRNGIVPEIAAGRITVREGSKVRRVESVATAAETPLTVGLLIDVSDSMQKTLPDVQEAAIRFLETILGERDRAFLVTFDTRARLMQPATSDVAQLRRRIMAIRPDGFTALHDAMVLGLLQFEGIKGRRAMIVFSDGIDLTSHYTPTDVAELAKRVNVPIHVIAAVPGVPATLTAGSPPPPTGDPADRELKRVAQSTAGTSHTLHSLAELPDVYTRIEAALRAQILAFVRTDPGTRENEWRSVTVEVNGEDLEVYAPEGYYAAW
ncbi:MAG TPA: VWA domain-containing protein [Thermoanaerobaculia bacterium]|nr:VWA domain-containing protein [Thermoanaerobaculia bacterium]